jgi:protein-L-isoaspartate(D-aspartate) O-methyltransferase
MGVKNIVEPILQALSILPRKEHGPDKIAPVGEEARFAGARRRMVQEQLSSLKHGITDARVRAAMGKVPRHRFVPAELLPRAYDNCALSIGHGQTISQPFVVAFMTEQLDLQPTDRVLEIGTGSGYQVAVLAELAREVYTIEIVAALAQRAGAELKQLGYTNIQLRAGDGCLGWPEAAPFDVIIVTCAPEQRPQPLIEQLRDGGRMIIPVGPDGDQKLVLFRKQGMHLEERALLPVRFVPMTGRAIQA